MEETRTAPISSLQGGRRYRLPRICAPCSLLCLFRGDFDRALRYVYGLPRVQLQQFRKKKGKRGPGNKADADADAEAGEGAPKAAEESVPEPKSPVGLKLLAGEGGGGSTPFEVRFERFSVMAWVLSGLLLLLAVVVAGCVMHVCQCRKRRGPRRNSATVRGLVPRSPALWRVPMRCKNRRRCKSRRRMMSPMHIMSVLVSRGFRSILKARQLVAGIYHFRLPVETALVMIM